MEKEGMGLYRTKAIVLRSRKFAETDSLLTLLTRKKGKVTVIAKGVRKSNSSLRGGVQLFTYNDMLLYEGRNLDIVTQSQCLEAFTSIQENMEAMAAASYWCELLDKFVPDGERDLSLFALALAGFHLLALDYDELTMRALEVKLLLQRGYMPELERCVSCGRILQHGEPIGFSAVKGGVLCGSCRQGDVVPMTSESVRAWQQLQRIELTKLGRLKVSGGGLSALDKALEKYLAVQLECPLKARPILREIVQTP
jgi:DNA repair protein RecO (recombination protein O)